MEALYQDLLAIELNQIIMWLAGILIGAAAQLNKLSEDKQGGRFFCL